jgi:hypothetical protein
MAHINSWFTELEDSDLPVRYVSLPEGKRMEVDSEIIWGFLKMVDPQNHGFQY